MTDVQASSWPVPEVRTLIDIFTEVPQLLETSVCAGQSRAASIRSLRLVSKDMSGMALRAVRSCSVQLGGGASPDPRQVVRLMSHALMQSMHLTVLIRSDSGAPSAAQQLATCMQQAQQLIAGMGPSIHRLTHLHLTVTPVSKHSQSTSLASCKQQGSVWEDAGENDKGKRSLSSIETYNKVLCPTHLTVVPASVFKLLAAAVPHLRQLSLSGCCRDAALSTFGAACPQLHELRVEAAYVRPEALHKLHVFLPQLTHFSLWQRGVAGDVLQHAISACFATTSLCTSLTTLELDFGAEVQMKCLEATWRLLPRGIQELRVTCHLWGIEGASCVFTTLHRLFVLQHLFSSLLQLLDFAPCLQALTVQRDQPIDLDLTLDTLVGSPTPALASLKQRLHGMHLSFPTCRLVANSVMTAEVLSLLPPVPSTRTLQARIVCSSPGVVLHDLPRVFPNLTALDLACMVFFPCPQPLAEECLLPLAGCTKMQELCLDMLVSYTTTGLLKLCLALPLLTQMKCHLCEGLDFEELCEVLHDEMPNCRVMLLSDGDH